MRILNDAEKTEVLYGTENIISRQMLAFPNLREKVDAYFDHTGPSALVTCEPIWNAIKVLVKRDIKLRYITDITKENIAYCKQMIEYFELRHLNGAKGNFGIADGIDCIIHSVLEKEQAPMQAILTNVKSFVEAQQYLFDTLWIKAIPAEQRFRVIEEGLEADFIKTIRDPYKVQSLGFDLVRQAREEILTIFSTANAFQRQVRSGAVKSLMEGSIFRRGKSKNSYSI